MESPLQAMVRNSARRQIKIFVSDNCGSLESDINGFLTELQADRVVDIKYSAEMLDAGTWFYSAMVIYEMYV